MLEKKSHLCIHKQESFFHRDHCMEFRFILRPAVTSVTCNTVSNSESHNQEEKTVEHFEYRKKRSSRRQRERFPT